MSKRQKHMSGENDGNRRGFLKKTGRWLLAGALGGVCGYLGKDALTHVGAQECDGECGKCPESGDCRQGDEWVWQIDPDKCTACGKCATHCVRHGSAVRCFQKYRQCGYCDLCSGFFEPDYLALNAGAENQLCPTGALERKFIEEPYFEYRVNRDLCVGCARCVEYCAAYGNASLYLQIDPELCRHCNECSIARACPGQAISRIPRVQAVLVEEG
jgi:Na+-translocating ferredoxin:NAD+ oxidoreductase subunit B